MQGDNSSDSDGRFVITNHSARQYLILDFSESALVLSNRRYSGRGESRQMGFKFAIGQAVEYKPANGPVALCTVVKQMPEEDGQCDCSYRIKNEQEAFERNVHECALTATDKPANLYGFIARLHRAKHH